MEKIFKLEWEGEHLVFDNLCGDTELVIINGDSMEEIEKKLNDLILEQKSHKTRMYKNVVYNSNLIEKIIRVD